MHSRARLILLPIGLLVATVAVAGQIAGGCVFDFQDDCTRNLGLGVACAGLTGAGSSGGASTTSSGSGTTGGGGSTGCTDAAECQVPAGPCASLGTATCVKGSCGVTYQAGPAPSQQYGGCDTNWCGDAGIETELVDAGNVYVDDGNTCNTNGCSSIGMPTHGTLATDAPCITTTMSMGYCEPDPYSGLLSCEECTPSDQSTCLSIPGSSCVQGGKCVPAHCTDHMTDYDETDTDCGGTACLPCPTGDACKIPNDCVSLVCVSNICIAPSCSDMVQNGTETDRDCGGSCPSACGATQKCTVPKDCQSGVCLPTMPGSSNTCAAPTCTDGVQNGSETGVDCGGSDEGSLCPPCATADAGG
jgi:hypothetical protein